jgi:hypothetical protein
MTAGERLTFAASLARVGRNPALEELFYFDLTRALRLRIDVAVKF